ncbi:MAG: helix-turn-helix domain-containing protein [Bacteroidales bacterium]|nr:helix-turn-helix domain-containing protein [Bacteroidales bacterium]
MATQTKIHIGKMIKAVFDESGLSVAELARCINTARSNVYFIFERPSIDMEQLLMLCKALNHNFLDDIQLLNGMKSELCPKEIHIDLNLNDLTTEEARQVALFLEALKSEKAAKQTVNNSD